MNRQKQTFSVTLVNETRGLSKTLQVASDDYILDVAEAHGLNLPYSCRAGACFDCLAKVQTGSVEQTAKAMAFLRPDEVEAGYILLCAASPTSNCTIATHQEEEFFAD